MEIIVVDDGSTDKTLNKIVDKLSHGCLNFKILSTGGKGLGYARQLVVDNASGKYILWIDGDMIIPRNYVCLQVEFMERNSLLGKARARWGILNEKPLPAKLEEMRVLEQPTTSRAAHLVGIGGSICRTRALRAIGGFDKSIHGAGEDIDLAIRLEAASWKSSISNAVFYHRFRRTWRELWKQYYWYGYGIHFINSKHKAVVKIWKYLPPFPLIEGIRRAIVAYRFRNELVAFLLPIQYSFKYLAWVIGYFRSHFNGYGHSNVRTL
jgi:glycosyltransferase involved in cell wall biosynthesis